MLRMNHSGFAQISFVLILGVVFLAYQQSAVQRTENKIKFQAGQAESEKLDAANISAMKQVEDFVGRLCKSLYMLTGNYENFATKSPVL